MRHSSDHILTSHAGSLPRPDALIDANRAFYEDKSMAADGFGAVLGDAVMEVVRRQQEAGIDVPGDGEFGKAMAQKVNYGSWWRYSWLRLGGLAAGGLTLYEMEPKRSAPGAVVLTSFG